MWDAMKTLGYDFFIGILGSSSLSIAVSPNIRICALAISGSHSS